MMKTVFLFKDPIKKHSHLEVDVRYELGSLSSRGYYAHVTPMTETIKHGHAIREQMMLGSHAESGFKMFLEGTKRKSEMRLSQWQSAVALKTKEIVDLFEKEEYIKINTLITNLLVIK